jgi:hypothetical protein
MNMRFGTWNVINMYRAGSFRTVAEGISNIVSNNIKYHTRVFIL